MTSSRKLANSLFPLLTLLTLSIAVHAADPGSIADLTINKTGPAKVNAGDDATFTLVVSNNGPAQTTATVTDTLPADWTVISTSSAAGSCTGAGSGVATCNVTVTVAAPTTIVVMVHVPFLCQPTTAVNTATVTGQLPDPNPNNNTATLTSTVSLPSAGPGACIPHRNPTDDGKPGSVLFAGLYTSGASSSDPQNNTRVNLTNTHPSLSVTVHLFFVDGATCSIADSFLCLTANHTTSFLMSDIDPGTRGYMMALAVDGPPGFAGGTNSGCPISFNYLIGNANIKFTGSPRRDIDLESEAVASQFGSPVPTCDPNKPFAELFFDGTPRGYAQLPRVLAADSLPSRADGNDTILFLARIDGNWGVGLQPLGTIFGLLYNDEENVVSFNLNAGTCLLRTTLSNSTLRTTPRYEQFLSAGRTGWMKVYAANENAAIVGAIHNRNDNSQTSPGAFEGGHNLHILRLQPSAVITVPVFPPSC